MKCSTILFELVAVAAMTGVAAAQAHKDQHAQPASRPTGTIQRERPAEPVNAKTNPPHQQVYRNARTGQDERHTVVVEHRPPTVVARDHYAHAFTPGYHARNGWQHFYPDGGWLSTWGVANWSDVGTVTCEAANETTGALYPVTAPHEASAWADATVDEVLDQALDECAADAGVGACAPATPSCSFTGP
jgi:hypothetical protein